MAVFSFSNRVKRLSSTTHIRLKLAVMLGELTRAILAGKTGRWKTQKDK
jgi:hypothetical protein